MRLKFYGTRGSIPICDASFQHFGGNTTCLQITFTDTNRVVIIDAGTGLRNLGRDLRAIGHKQEQIVIVFTHFHWDHIQGFPFFAQAYDPGQKITLLTLGRDQTITNLREIFEVRMQAEYFPVQLDHMGATFEFLQIAVAANTSPAATMWIPWSARKGTTIPAAHIVSGSSAMERCSMFSQMLSTASRLIGG